METGHNSSSKHDTASEFTCSECIDYLALVVQGVLHVDAVTARARLQRICTNMRSKAIALHGLRAEPKSTLATPTIVTDKLRTC